MAVLDKDTLETNIDSTITTNGTGDITGADLNGTLKDMVDSLEAVIQEKTTIQRNAITSPELVAGLKIFNTDNGRVEVYSGTAWKGLGTKETILLDCSADPNYPAALIGDYIIVTVAGKIGGASGITVYVNDVVYCTAISAAGNQATVGSNWRISRSAGTAFNDVLSVDIFLSSAQILALNATPIQAVAAPGTGKIIVPLSWIATYNHATTKYNAGAGPINFMFDTATCALAVAIPDLSQVNASATVIANQINGAFGASLSNKALMLKAMIADYAGGDGSVSIKLFYKIVTL